MEGLIEKSEERQRSVSDNLLEKIETTRELLGQSQRGIRAIIREECDAVASSSRADNFEVSLISCAKALKEILWQYQDDYTSQVREYVRSLAEGEIATSITEIQGFRTNIQKMVDKVHTSH